jgi:hypothetical protein
MGTRLYPIADNATLEALCGAPAGAWEKMEEIVSTFSEQTEEAFRAQDSAFEQNEGTGDCYDFQLYGWGKLNSQQYAAIAKHCPDQEPWGGSTTDPEAINAILGQLRHGLNLAMIHRNKITGLGWG